MEEVVDSWVSQIYVQYEGNKMILGMNNGRVVVYDISGLYNSKQIQVVRHSKTRLNYNPFKNANEDFIKCVNNMKLD